MDKIATKIDHTLLKPDATETEINKICQEAIDYSFASVCVNPTWVNHCANKLKNSSVNVCTVIGFPLGAATTTTKAFEAQNAIENGATELDMVLNIGALKDKDFQKVREDIATVVATAKDNAIVKVIIETALLTKEEKITACTLAKEAGAHFVKTSTGFSGGGATVADVKLMSTTVGPSVGVKASGGIRTAKDAQKMLEAGATRIGASSSVAIIKG